MDWRTTILVAVLLAPVGGLALIPMKVIIGF